MREIKFRAWDKELENMIYTKAEQFDNGLFFRVETHFDDEEPVWMQYTGLKDKNGKEIYDGDIVKINEYVFANTYEDVYKEVRYSNNAEWLAGSSMLSRIYTRCEVAGNIYECPEVLEV